MPRYLSLGSVLLWCSQIRAVLSWKLLKSQQVIVSVWSLWWLMSHQRLVRPYVDAQCCFQECQHIQICVQLQGICMSKDQAGHYIALCHMESYPESDMCASCKKMIRRNMDRIENAQPYHTPTPPSCVMLLASKPTEHAPMTVAFIALTYKQYVSFKLVGVVLWGQ